MSGSRNLERLLGTPQIYTSTVFPTIIECMAFTKCFDSALLISFLCIVNFRLIAFSRYCRVKISLNQCHPLLLEYESPNTHIGSETAINIEEADEKK
jgi:hypothetical protein